MMILKSLPLWGEGAPVRTLGRMRGQSEEQASLEELCRAGDRPRRPIFQGFALRGEFLFHVEKEPMAQATLSWPFGPIHLEDARGSAQDGHSVSIFAHPLEPPLRGTRTCRGKQNFRRAKSEWRSKITSGPTGARAVPKLRRMRFPFRA